MISGFLITSIILKHEGSARSFFPRFYERRVRRLLPPAIPVFAITLIAGWYLMPPEAFAETAQSLLAALAFVSNFFFLFQAGYFDGPS